MSDADAIYRDHTQLANLISAGAREMVNQARALGLTWSLRIATLSTAQPIEQGGFTGVLDGDSVAISLTNMTGESMVAGTRVYCLLIPPAGNFIVGVVEPPPISIFGVANSGGIVAQSNGTEAAVPALSWLVEPEAHIRPRWIGKVTATINTFVNTATDSVMIIRIRRDSGVGTQLIGWRVDASSAATSVQTNTLVGYITNDTDTTSAVTLALTVQTGNGAAIMGIYTDGTLPIVIGVEELCPIRDNPTLGSIAISI